MKIKFSQFVIIMIFSCIPVFPQEIYQNYIQAYGEGPRGQYLLGFETQNYSEADAVGYARNEIMEFTSGMIFGYSFVYKVENKLTHSEGYFELTPTAKIKETDPNLTLRQFQEKQDAIRIQSIYRLSEDQKTYVKGFQSSIAQITEGEALGPIETKWEQRLQIYIDALKNAILNEARDRYKSRPLFIKGRLLLKESPQFSIISGQWRVHVKIHLMIKDVKFQDIY